MATPYDLDNSPRQRRILQIVSDLRRGDLKGVRVLDLGCAHGVFALELARRGAEVVGVEGRDSWVAMANQAKHDLGLPNVTFIQGDVRKISRETLGQFDVVLCLGLLYHLDAEDAVQLLRTIHGMCADFAVIDTQIAVKPDADLALGGHTYRGWRYREHAVSATADQKEEILGASLDDEFSFWFSRPSLLNLLRHVGFSSVLESRNPFDNLYLNGELRMHEDVVSLVAMKGVGVGDFVGLTDQARAQEDWPESSKGLLLERPWNRLALSKRIARRLKALLP